MNASSPARRSSNCVSTAGRRRHADRQPNLEGDGEIRCGAGEGGATNAAEPDDRRRGPPGGVADLLSPCSGLPGTCTATQFRPRGRHQAGTLLAVAGANGAGQSVRGADGGVCIDLVVQIGVEPTARGESRSSPCWAGSRGASSRPRTSSPRRTARCSGAGVRRILIVFEQFGIDLATLPTVRGYGTRCGSRQTLTSFLCAV